MQKEEKFGRSRFWISLVIIAILAALAYYFFYYSGAPKSEKEETTTKPGLSEPKSVERGPQPESAIERKKITAGPEEEEELVSAVTEEEAPEIVTPEPQEDDCTRIRNDVLEFFRYLDNQKYIKQLKLQKNTYSCFKELMKELAANPPNPAREGESSKLMMQNLFYFFRILDKDSMRMVRAVMEHEKDTAELNLKVFYNWLTLGDRCPDPDNIRPSFKVQYRYAGFLLNTTGGRAYLYRRSPHLRLLTTYYCLLIVHKADKIGENNWGLNIFPLIGPLADEISRYPELQFQGEYLERLNQIREYYSERR